jgi:tetratricopeptide (TPR) repeat protein
LRRLEQRSDAWLLVLLVVSFAPIANVVRITAPGDMGAPMAERFLYVPSMFLCLLVGRAAVALWDRTEARGVRAAVAVGAAGVVVAAGLKAASAARVWSDEMTLFTTMVAHAPDAQLPRTLLGTLHRREGRYPEAVAALEAALVRIPDESAGERLAVSNNLAGAVAALGDRERARRLLEQAAEYGQGTVSVHNNLAVLERLEGNLAAAEAALDRALAEDPWHDQALVQRGQVRLARGNAQGAMEDLERYLERYPATFELLVALADARGRLGQRQRARSLLQRAARLRPGAPEALIPLGRLAMADGRWRDASGAFEEVVRRHPEHVPALNGAAIVAARLGDGERARGLLERAERVRPSDPSTVLNLARLDLEAGARGRARERIVDALAAHPDHPQLRGALEQLGSPP